jgi:putative ABC transport system permease protein
MRFYTLALINIASKKARSIGLVAAIAFAVMTVVTLAIVSSGLEQSAAAIITVGKADFTVAQKGASDLLTSTIDEDQLHTLQGIHGVQSAIGVLVETENLGPATPVFIEIGIQPSDLAPFGVHVLQGSAYSADAAHEVMLGWRAASTLGLHVGSTLQANGTINRVVGIFSTGNSFGDAGAMFPLPALQAYNRLPGIVSLAFVRVAPGASHAAVEKRITYAMPEMTTIETASQFGRADLSLTYLQAAVTGSTILAVIIGAIIVGITMLLSLFERTRELGLLRAVGWTRRRLVTLLLAENLTLALVGALVGVGLTFAVAALLEHLPSLRGVLHPNYTPDAYWRALYTALGMTLLGSLYPAIRAAILTPLKALSYE